MTNKATPEQQKPEPIQLPLVWEFPPNIESRYVTHVLVQPGEHEVIISFFETHIPPMVGTAEQNEAFLKQIGSIRAECIGRFVIAPERMQGIIDAFQTGFDAYRSSKLSGSEADK